MKRVTAFGPMSGTGKHAINGSYYHNVYHIQLCNSVSKIFWDPSHFIILVVFITQHSLLKRVQALESDSPSLGLNSSPPTYQSRGHGQCCQSP